MKWYNNERTACLDLSKIIFWVYSQKGGELKVWIGATEPLVFNGEDGMQIYRMLQSEKEVL